MITRVFLLVATGLLVTSCSSESEPELTIPDFPSETQSETTSTPDSLTTGADTSTVDEPVFNKPAPVLQAPEEELLGLRDEELAEQGYASNGDGTFIPVETHSQNSHPQDTALYPADAVAVNGRKSSVGDLPFSLNGAGKFGSGITTAAYKDAVRFLIWNSRVSSQDWVQKDGPLVERMLSGMGPYATETVIRSMARDALTGVGTPVLEMNAKVLAKYAPAPASICAGFTDNCTNAPASTVGDAPSVSVVSTPGGQKGLRFTTPVSYRFYSLNENVVSAPNVEVSYTATIMMAPNPDLSSPLKWVVVGFSSSKGGAK